MVRIVWTLQAVNDLESIFDFISRDSLKYARIQIIRIRERVKFLKKYPEAGRIVPEIGDKTIRELILGNYRIIYRFNKHSALAEIITIHHSAKQIKIT
jgi:addiction module RelE/StbE family toxin